MGRPEEIHQLHQQRSVLIMIFTAFLILCTYLSGVGFAIPALYYANKYCGTYERTGINICWLSWVVVFIGFVIWMLYVIPAAWNLTTKRLPNYISPKVKEIYTALDKFVRHER